MGDGTGITLSSTQIGLARHALGLPNRRRMSYRNHFVVDGGLDHDEWMRMVEIRAARRSPGNEITGQMDLFRLTEAGARSALGRRERLDPEDFPGGSSIRRLRGGEAASHG